MSVSDKIGLLSGFGWIADHGVLLTLLICWLLTPGAMFVIGFVGEGRLVPVRPSRQFLSFLPGDFFLGGAAAGLLVLAQGLPSGHHLYNARWWHILVLTAAACIAAAFTWTEWKSKIYPKRAILSPTKLYHNIVLYVGYGYVIVTTLVAVAVGSDWSSAGFVAGFLASLSSCAVWVYLCVRDNPFSSVTARYKTRFAHVTDWSPPRILP